MNVYQSKQQTNMFFNHCIYFMYFMNWRHKKLCKFYYRLYYGKISTLSQIFFQNLPLLKTGKFPNYLVKIAENLSKFNIRKIHSKFFRIGNFRNRITSFEIIESKSKNKNNMINLILFFRNFQNISHTCKIQHFVQI